jgi:hypothetical protein
MPKHKFERACYKNGREIQEHLLKLGYHWFKEGVKYLGEDYLYTNTDGSFSFSCKRKEGTKFYDADLVLANVRLNGVHAEILIIDDLAEDLEHPYQAIINKIVEQEPDNWEEAVMFLGNIGMKSKFMEVKSKKLISCFAWDETPQGHGFWDDMHGVLRY